MNTAVPFDLRSWNTARLAEVEAALSHWVAEDAPERLSDAMRYAVLDGGKRLRPLLVLAACEAVDGNAEAALRAACAVELIHAYSLVHDDMPCMDNDILRRGKPTVHVKFGEAGALLAGDALQALAFELLAPEGDAVPASIQANLCRLLARAAGHEGMAGGQAIDLASVGLALDEDALRRMHRMKTGALLQGSVEMGAVCGAPTPAVLDALRGYGAALGLAFQVRDDILYIEVSSAQLGKTAGKDVAQAKSTYPALLGMDGAKAKLAELDALMREALAPYGAGADPLRALGELAIHRAH